MPATVSHALSMTTPDDPAFENQPQHWNSAHNVTLNISASEISGLFSNAGGVSWGLNANSITATVATNYMASAQSSVFAGVGETVGTIAGTDLAMTVDTAGVNIGYPKWITTYVNDLTSGRAGVGETVGTIAGSDLAMTVDTDGVSIGYPKWLTTAMASNRGTDFVQATAAFAGTNASGTINSTGISVSVSSPLWFSEWPGFPYLQTLGAQSKVSGTTAATGGSTQVTASLYLAPQQIDANLSFNQIGFFASCQTVAGTGTATVGYFVGIYTESNSTKLNLLSSLQFGMRISQNSVTNYSASLWWGTNSTSNSTGVAGNVSASFTGQRYVLLTSGANSLSAGQYYFAFGHTAATANANLNSSNSMMGPATALSLGSMGNNAAIDFVRWRGAFSTTTNTNVTGLGVFPATIDITALTSQANTCLYPQIIFRTATV